MKTIVTYSSSQRPVNAYPERIISPLRPGICCLTHMERIGDLEEEDGVPFAYKRCRSCGFTVRWFPEEAQRAGLRKAAGKLLVGITGQDGTGRRRVPVTLFPRRQGRAGLLKLPVRQQGRQEEERLPVARRRARSGSR